MIAYTARRVLVGDDKVIAHDYTLTDADGVQLGITALEQNCVCGMGIHYTMSIEPSGMIWHPSDPLQACIYALLLVRFSKGEIPKNPLELIGLLGEADESGK